MENNLEILNLALGHAFKKEVFTDIEQRAIARSFSEIASALKTKEESNLKVVRDE